MDFEVFKKEVGKLKQVKLAEEDRVKKEYEELYKQTCAGILDLTRLLSEYVYYAEEELNLSEDIKNIEYTVSYAFTASIRWYKYLDRAVFYYTGHGESIMFTIEDFAFKKDVLSKDQLQYIGNAFNPKNLKYFVEDLLRRLESNKLYIEQ